ncbi:unnamed protein product [Clonostachys rosea]|uniref:Major facilitator superfamily (MFS) profile domain-containing protein n=1 Tax=Bionectria ochroleuca TaxID=29856 RepID=A0ABY6UM68_BIOOC|nr:unnamed protein product [Clonostachys rosea]
MSNLGFGKARYFNGTLFLSVVIIAVSTFNYGFDNQAFATTQSMDYFARQFGERNAKTGVYELPSDWLALFNSLNYIGFAAGVVIGSQISSMFGRRWCMFGMSCYALVTATIAVTSKSREQIMAARILNYIYVGIELAVVPTYQSEIVPAPVRGFVVGSYQMSLMAGGLVINAVCYGTGFIESNRSWQIPLGLFYIVPTIIAAAIFFVPESPRWLLRKNRPDEARRMLQRLRQGAFTEEEINAEFAQLQQALENEVEQGKFIELFKGKNLVRTAIVVGVNFFQQATGQAFSSQYGAVYVKTLGIINPRLFSLITSGIGVVICFTSLYTTDKMGRRIQLMASALLMAGALFTMGGLGVQSPVPTANMRGIVAMIAVFTIGFATGWGPLTYVVTTEVSSLRLRDLNSRVGFTVNVIFNWTVNFSIPYLVWPDKAGLGSKVGFIFGAIAILALIFTYMCVPECKGKTLEQVDWLFNNDVSLRKFGQTEVPANLETAHAYSKGVEKEGDIELGRSSHASKADSL